MANQTLLTNNEADSVSISILRNTLFDNPGTLDNDPSVFNFRFNSTPTYYLNEFGIYDGYCVQPWIPIDDGTFSADLYYSTEDFSIETSIDLDQDFILDETFTLTDESVQAAIFVLNNLTWEQLDGDSTLEGVIRDNDGNILNPTDDNGDYIYLEIADVQYLIWDLIYGIYAPEYGGDSVFDETAYGYRALNETTNAILKANVTPHATNYVPEKAGDQVGVILVPDDGSQFILSTVELSGLGDFVWLDENADGIQNDNEVGVAGVTVELLADLNNDGQIEITEVLDTTTTDANGFYSFDGIIADNYQVQFTATEEFNFTTANVGDDNSDSDVNSDGLTQTVILTSGENNLSLDAGLTPLASLGDFVWHDLNADGIQDAGEAGIEGATLNLLDSSGNPVASTITGADGGYLFEGLTPGDYQVQFTATEEFNFTTANVGDDGLDSDADSNGLTQTVTLTSGENNLSLDAGLITVASDELPVFDKGISNIVLYLQYEEGDFIKVKIDSFDDDEVFDSNSLNLQGFVAENFPETELMAVSVKAGNNSDRNLGPGEGELFILAEDLGRSDLPLSNKANVEFDYSYVEDILLDKDGGVDVVTGSQEGDPLLNDQSQQFNIMEFVEQDKEVLSGTDEPDLFVFAEFNNQYARDVIKNFEAGVDLIDLSGVLDSLGVDQSNVTLTNHRRRHTTIKIDGDALVQVKNITEAQLADSILF